MRQVKLLLFFWGLVQLSGDLWSATVQVPPDFQALIFYKVLNFDRTGAERASGEFTVGMVYRSDVPASKEHFGETFAGFKQQLDDKLLFDKKIAVVALPLEKNSTMAAQLAGKPLQALYLCQDLGESLGEILSTASAHKMITYSAVPEYLYEGVTVVIKLVAGKSKIIINKGNADSVGLNLDPRLLQLAEVIPGK